MTDFQKALAKVRGLDPQKVYWRIDAAKESMGDAANTRSTGDRTSLLADVEFELECAMDDIREVLQAVERATSSARRRQRRR
jgi:hypothetical protein